MTLKELILSVDAKEYADSPLYQELRKLKPEYGSQWRICVKRNGNEIAVSNAHVGSLGDIVTYQIDVDPDLNVSKIQLLGAILNEIGSNGFSEAEESDLTSLTLRLRRRGFWCEMTNLQKAKIIR